MLEALHREVLRIGGRWGRLLAIDPLNEEAARHVMRAELDGGRRHRSIEVYARLRSMLAVELGVSPQPQTHDLYLQTIEDLTPAVAPLVGRDREMAVIESLVRRQQESALVLVRGSAGIGLSSFVRSVVEQSSEWGGRGVLILADAPDDVFATLTAVVEEVLRAAPSAMERLSERTRAILARLTPSFSSGSRRRWTSDATSASTSTTVGRCHPTAQVSGAIQTVVISACPRPSTLCATPAGIHSARAGGTTHVARAR